MITLPRLTKPRQKINLLIAALFVAVQLPLVFLFPQEVIADGTGSPVACNSNPNVNSNAANVAGSVVGTEANEDDGSYSSVSYTAATGKVVTGVCIKSGSQTSFTGGTDGHSPVLETNGSYGTRTFQNATKAPITPCYSVSGIGTQTVTVTVLDEDCQGISHIDVIHAQSRTETGSLKVNKTLLDEEGDVTGGNSEANNLGFRWGYNEGTVNRNMGTQVDDLAPGSYSVTENINAVEDYEFIGYYLGEGSCSDVEEDKTLPISTTVTANNITTVTLCNQLTEEEEVLGSITIIKDADSTDLQEFIFSATGLRGVATFSLTDKIGAAVTSQNKVTYTDLSANEYTFTEQAKAGWTLDSINCSKEDTATVVTVAKPKVTINLAAGDDVSCTFVNTLDEEDGEVLGDSDEVVLLGGRGSSEEVGAVLGASAEAAVGGVSAGYGAAASTSLSSLAGLGASLSAVGYGIVSLRKRQ